MSRCELNPETVSVSIDVPERIEKRARERCPENGVLEDYLWDYIFLDVDFDLSFS